MVANDKPRTTVGKQPVGKRGSWDHYLLFWLEDVCLTRAQNIVNCGSASYRTNMIITFLILSKKAMVDKDTFLYLFINSPEKK